jgi:hypothetical protein
MHHESLDVFPSPTRLVQGVLKEHLRRGELVDDSEIARLAPELGEPAADDGLFLSTCSICSLLRRLN